jgi:retron-type reverse transcriptase
MKRVGYLIEKIATIDNLYLAFWKARKGKDEKQAIIEYRKNLHQNLLTLQRQILIGKVEVGDYHYFTIFDPKERIICAADFSERVLHHALMNICHPYFEQHQIFDSYASRKGKGTYAAIDRAKVFTKEYRYFLKMDFRKYFDSISHEVLKGELKRLFKDEKLLSIFGQIIDSYEVTNKKGVPIGNLTSQYFANHFLSVADHFAKERLKIPAYTRYMDDVIIWSNDKTVLLKIGYAYQDFTAESLDLILKPFILNETKRGLPFLGYLVFPKELRLAKRSRERFIEKYKSYELNLENETWSQFTYQQHIQPLFAFVEKANSEGFRAKIMS